jgi:ABC-type polysaccharide/polyol phosphate export permease
MSTSHTIQTEAKLRSDWPAAVADFIDGLRRWELWFTLGWHDIRQRYRRSIVGPFWLTISMGAMVAGLAYMYAGLFGQPLEQYLPYVAVGLIVFNMITSIANEGSHVFISSARTILQIKAPLSLYVYQMLWRNVLILAHNMCIYFVLLLFIKIDAGVVSLLALPALFLDLLVGVWVGVILGGLSARYRDVPPIVASIMQVAFFLTPVFWTPGSLQGREVFVQLNPFYYLLEIIRMPLLGQAPPLTMWLVVIAMNVVGAAVALLFYARYRARIAYWV